MSKKNKRRWKKKKKGESGHGGTRGRERIGGVVTECVYRIKKPE